MKFSEFAKGFEMIILNTNVVYETMRLEPDASVLAWLDAQAAETLYLTSITFAELLIGVASLSDEKQKSRLTAAIDGLIGLYAERVLPFDTDAARHYSMSIVTAGQNGSVLPTPERCIAAIAAAHGYIIASRDAEVFESVGIKVINPWAWERGGTLAFFKERRKTTDGYY